MTTPPPEPAPSEKSKRDFSSPWMAVQLAWELGYMIAIPAVLLGFVGAYVDKAFHTSPLFLIAGFLLAVTLSAIAVYRKVREIIK